MFIHEDSHVQNVNMYAREHVAAIIRKYQGRNSHWGSGIPQSLHVDLFASTSRQLLGKLESLLGGSDPHALLSTCEKRHESSVKAESRFFQGVARWVALFYTNPPEGHNCKPSGGLNFRAHADLGGNRRHIRQCFEWRLCT